MTHAFGPRDSPGRRLQTMLTVLGRAVFHPIAWFDAPARRVAAPGLDSGERRMTSAMRLLLAVAALVVTAIDPIESRPFLSAIHVILAAYIVFAATSYLTALRGRPVSDFLYASEHWIDVGFYVALVGLSNASNSIYFVLYPFAILLASFRWGFRSGIAVTLVSLGFFVSLAFVTATGRFAFALNRVLLRSISLPVLGYLIARWGGHELRLRRRLALLRDISSLSNPRFGPDHLLAGALELLRDLYAADRCLAVLPSRDGQGYTLRQAVRGLTESAHEAASAPVALTTALLSFGEQDVVRSGPTRLKILSRLRHRSLDEGPDERSLDEIAELLGSDAYISVPLRMGGRLIGRLYLAGDHVTSESGDAEFLHQAAGQMMTLLSHVELVERLATRAAEDERLRIAMDIHDRLIQPYVGLQMGIGAVHELTEVADQRSVLPDVRERIAKLKELAVAGVAELRQYVGELRSGRALANGLAESLRRFAERFSEATGIDVAIDVAEDVHVGEVLAFEVFSMASEAVSNVRRHTGATSARIVLRTNDGRLVLQVENSAVPGAPTPAFVPQSISERAAALCGTVSVEASVEGGTVVTVELPLQAPGSDSSQPLLFKSVGGTNA